MKCAMSFSYGLEYIYREIYCGKMLPNKFFTCYDFNTMFTTVKELVYVHVYIFLCIFSFHTKLLCILTFS